MVKRSTSKEPEVTVRLTPALRRALEKMAVDTMRSVPNLARKILADHLRDGGYLSDDGVAQEWARELEAEGLNVAIVRNKKPGRRGETA